MVAKYIFDGRSSFFVVTHNHLLLGRDSQRCIIELAVFTKLVSEAVMQAKLTRLLLLKKKN